MCIHNYDCKCRRMRYLSAGVYSKREVMNWIDGNHLISLFNNVNISLSRVFCVMCNRKALFLFKNAQSLVCSCTSYGHRHHCLMSFHFERCYCREKMSIAEREGWRGARERLATDCISMHLFHLFMIPFLNRKKGILFVRNRLFYLQVFM